MPKSKSRDGFRIGRQLRKNSGRALVVSECFFRQSWSERIRCYFDGHSIALPGTLGLLHKTVKRGNFSSRIIGGVLASTHRWKRRRHVEDGSLASLKTGPKK